MKKDSKQRLFEMMNKLDSSFKPKVNEISYDDANKHYSSYQKQLESVFSEFDNKSVEMIIKSSHLAQNTHTFLTDVNVMLNTRSVRGSDNEGNYSVAISFKIGDTLSINLHEESNNYTKDFVYLHDERYHEYFLKEEDIDMIIRFVRKASTYTKVEEQTVNRIIQEITTKLKVKE